MDQQTPVTGEACPVWGLLWAISMPHPSRGLVFFSNNKERRGKSLLKCSNPQTTTCTYGERGATNPCTQHPALLIPRHVLTSGPVCLSTGLEGGQPLLSIALPQLDYFAHVSPLQALFHPPK